MTSKVQKLQRASLYDPIKVEVSTKFSTPSKLLQHYLFIPAKYKVRKIYRENINILQMNYSNFIWIDIIKISRNFSLKDVYLTYIVNEHAGKSILVFGATCNNVQRLTLMLRNLGFPAVCLHGMLRKSNQFWMFVLILSQLNVVCGVSLHAFFFSKGKCLNQSVWELWISSKAEAGTF